MKITEWLSPRAVAEMLGVSETRVRQMADSQLPTASLGPRATGFHRGAVEALAARKRGEQTSLPLTGMSPPGRLATKIVDTVMTYRSDWDNRHDAAVHVRAWRRHAEDGGQHVVVLGGLDEQIVSLNQHWPEAVAELVRLVPTITIGQTVFLEYRPEDYSDGVQWLGVKTLIETRNASRNARATDRLDDPGHPLRIDFTDLEQVVGDRFFVFAKGTYTAANVQRWLREQARDHTVTQIDVLIDDWDVTDVVTHCRALGAYAEQHPDDTLLASATALASHLAKARVDERDRMPRPDRTRPEYVRDDEEAQWPEPDRFATRVVQPDVSQADRDLLADLATRYPILDDDAATVLATIDHLGELQYEVDEHADHPDPDLHGGLADAIFLMSNAVNILNGFDMAYRYPGPPWIPRGPYEVNGPWTRAYIDQLTDRRFGAPASARERRLAAQLRKHVATDTKQDRDLWFGTDPAGRLVAVVVGVGGDDVAGEWFAVEWPARVGQEFMTPGARVVADRAQFDTPVMVVRASGVVDLLPRTAEYMEQPWSYGFDSSGPHDLAQHIASAMEYELGDRQARDMIERMVVAADERGLDLRVDQIRAAAGTTGR